jgi:hypothetical protein
MIAADVNHDDRITASDLVALRKLVLGVHSEFQNNTSWRFIDGAYTFPVPDDPWAEEFAEDYYIDYLNNDMAIDFIGTKIGDVNNSSAVNARSGYYESRSFEDLNLVIENKVVKIGEEFNIEFKIDQAIDIRGLQLALSLNGLNVLDIKEGTLSIDESKSYITEGDLRISYDHNNREVIPANNTLFSLAVKANESGILSDMVSLSESHFEAEAYDAQLNVAEIDLNWDDMNIDQFVFNVAQNEPNPWQNITSIEVVMPKSGIVNLVIVDISGKVIYSDRRKLMKGASKINLSKDMILSSGVMFYEVEFEGKVVRKKMFSVR